MHSRNYRLALTKASKSMVRVRNPRRLLRMIARFIDHTVGLAHTSILVHDPLRERYLFVDSKGTLRIPPSLVKLDADHPLIRWFVVREPRARSRREVLTRSEIAKMVSDKGLLAADPALRAKLGTLSSSMSVLRAEACIAIRYKGELLGVFLLGRKLRGRSFTSHEVEFFQTLANDAAIAIKASQYQEHLLVRNRELEEKSRALAEKVDEIEDMRQRERQNYYDTVMSLAREVDEKDHYTFGHSQDVEWLGLMAAEALGIDLAGRKRDVLVASLRLHDVGKIGIPDAILKKQAALTEEEMHLMREHVRKGARILEPLSDFRDVARIVLHHHEHYDGTGYPYGLKGEEIPLESRIVTVADAFHAMVSDRPYRKGFSFDFAIQELERGRGTQFDPQVVDAFVKALRGTLKLPSGLDSLPMTGTG